MLLTDSLRSHVERFLKRSYVLQKVTDIQAADLSNRSWQEQITVMQPYKGYFNAGDAMPVHPFNPDWYVGGSVLVPSGSSSIVEITRFQLQQFTVSIKELAEWFGLEIALIVVDKCLAPRES